MRYCFWRIPWPPEVCAAPYNPSDALLQQWATAGPVQPCIRLAWTLYCRTLQEGVDYLALAAQAGRQLLVADFRAAERNLDWPAVAAAQMLAGGRVRRFVTSGGLEGCAYRAGLHAIWRRPFWGGAALLLALEAGRA